MGADEFTGELRNVHWTGSQAEALGFAAGVLQACGMREIHTIDDYDRWSAS